MVSNPIHMDHKSFIKLPNPKHIDAKISLSPNPQCYFTLFHTHTNISVSQTTFLVGQRI